ncbi:Flavodoxin [Lachnospiraceae bacterium TWA4]|nr:Flavodoxin [Lachnospiraceae bacterium TWA4]
MKKMISIFIVFILALSITACAEKNTESNSSTAEEGKYSEITEAVDDDLQKTDNSNVLVVYFSNTGTTEQIAKLIGEILDADMHQIIAKAPYTDEDRDYTNNSSRCNREQADETARPEIDGNVENLEQYDTIFLGYPIWHGQAPRIISTFIESYDFSDKIIIPFCTSHSSGIGSSADNLHELVQGATWKEGERFSVDSDKQEVQKWIDRLGISFHVTEEAVGVFDMENKKVKLNSGYDMPIVGLGTYALSDEECYNSVRALLENGGRLIDTAYMYHNEAAVGRAVRDSGVPREEIFVTTKIYPSQFGNPKAAIDLALETLDIEYIDLMLLHHPGKGDVDAYKTMEQYVADGKIKSIGLSNWYIKELENFLPQVSITPAVVQNEIHPYYQETDVIPYIQNLGIVVESWFPLGGRGYTKELLINETIMKIAENHNVSAAQVILRWDLQNGVIVMPGSSNPKHIKENLDVFDFELSEDEMNQIRGLNRDEKHDWY